MGRSIPVGTIESLPRTIELTVQRPLVHCNHRPPPLQHHNQIRAYLSASYAISLPFAVMLVTISVSVAFIILDVLSVTKALKSVLPVGINPFWKITFVFKCLTDAVVLDDFKTALDKIRDFRLSKLVTANDDDERFLPDGSPAFRNKKQFLSSVSVGCIVGQ
jgi:hypothetical protein